MKVYDFDGTIYDGDSSLDFFFFVMGRRPYLLFLFPLQLFGIFAYIMRLSSKENMKEAFFMFVKYISVEAMVEHFWRKKARKIKLWYLRQQQQNDVIISASPEFLLEPLVKQRLCCKLIASRLDIVSGKFIGKNCRDEEKLIRFRESFGDEDIEAFYGDSVSDVSLARAAKQSFMVKGNKCIPWQDYKSGPLSKIRETYLTKEFALFVFCGGMGTLTNFVFSLLISTKLNPSVSYICGYGISLFTAYTLNAKLIFHQRLECGAFIKFIISYIPNFLILFTFVLIFLNLFGWNKVIVYGLAGLLGLPVTFVLVKMVAFRKKGEK
jgi:putative flippase GtrA